jgi:hypothetical protein
LPSDATIMAISVRARTAGESVSRSGTTKPLTISSMA